MSNRVNLALGHSAGGLLRRACRQFGVPGSVVVIDDELGVGPLMNDAVRSTWWREVSAGYMNDYEVACKPYAEFNAVLGSASSAEIVLWSGTVHDEYVFIRMAAACLGEITDLSIIEAPKEKYASSIGGFHPDKLASFEPLKRSLAVTERRALADEFETLRHTEGVRNLTDDGLELRGDDDADHEVISAAETQWRKSIRVLGHAMAARDDRNWLSDMFLFWRMKKLVDAGYLEHRGESWFVDDQSSEVRLRP